MKLTPKSPPSVVVREWVRRLRSGKIEQTQGQLATYGCSSRCCLGVLCDMAVEAGIAHVRFDAEDRKVYYYDDRDTNQFELPKAVQEWAALRTDAGGIDVGNSLMRYNDDLNWSFRKIASHIMKQPKGLFTKRLALNVGKKA